ncbi:hypothetical protein DEJ39_02465 [Bacteroidetes bacterium SCGC AAA795-G10]|nr:hypothetical protein DEJ39_02465 [Bacteroidetes bacterium SCGC AAA795-G10]
MIREFEKILVDFPDLESLSLEQKNKILSKGEEMGFNRDELSLYIENKISSKISKKSSSIKSCPSCGSDIKLFSVKCKDCGIYFSNVSASTEIQKFNSKFFEVVKNKNITDVIKFIQSFKFPNDTQTLIELFVNSENLVFKKPSIFQAQVNNELQKFSSRIIDKIELIKLNDSRLSFLDLIIEEFKENSKTDYMTTRFLKKSIMKRNKHLNQIMISVILIPIILFIMSKPELKMAISEELLGVIYISIIQIIPILIIKGFIDIKRGNNFMKHLDKKTHLSIVGLIYQYKLTRMIKNEW